MRLRARLMMYTAAAAIAGSAALAAIDGDAVADAYLAQGYSFVEVKVGLTQTKVEAIKNGIKVELVYDNASGAIIEQEQERADGEDLGRSGKDVRSVGRDFEDRDDDDDDDSDDDDDDDDDDVDDDDDDDSDDDDSDDDHDDDRDDDKDDEDEDEDDDDEDDEDEDDEDDDDEDDDDKGDDD